MLIMILMMMIMMRMSYFNSVLEYTGFWYQWCGGGTYKVVLSDCPEYLNLSPYQLLWSAIVSLPYDLLSMSQRQKINFPLLVRGLECLHLNLRLGWCLISIIDWTSPDIHRNSLLLQTEVVSLKVWIFECWDYLALFMGVTRIRGLKANI